MPEGYHVILPFAVIKTGSFFHASLWSSLDALLGEIS